MHSRLTLRSSFTGLCHPEGFSAVLGALALIGCSSGTAASMDGTPSPDPITSSFSVGGSVSGLAGGGLVLQLNGAGDLPVSASGSFSFATKIQSGGNYAVTVKTQPAAPLQTCTVSSGLGTVGSADVTSVSVVCSTDAFKVGGTVSGLAGTLVLQNNGGDDLVLSDNGDFSFVTPVAAGAGYSVSVKTQPAAQICTVSAGAGSVGSAAITGIQVSCGTPTTCLAIKAAMPNAADGDYVIDPDGAGALPPLTAFCDMTTDGGGYTMYAVTGGISTNRFDQENSCTALGLKMIVPRSKAHLSAMWNKYGASYFTTVPGVYGLAGGQDWTGCVMSSADMTCAQNWVAIDSGGWWLRDTTYTEPNGDYTAGCWLAVTAAPDENGELHFNDANCSYYTGPSYVCSDNAKQ